MEITSKDNRNRMRILVSLLLKPNWTNSDIAEYTGVSSPTTVIKIKRTAINEYGGKIVGVNGSVKVDSVLKAIGTSLEEQCRKCSMLGFDLEKEASL